MAGRNGDLNSGSHRTGRDLYSQLYSWNLARSEVSSSRSQWYIYKSSPRPEEMFVWALKKTNARVMVKLCTAVDVNGSRMIGFAGCFAEPQSGGGGEWRLGVAIGSCHLIRQTTFGSQDGGGQ